jgi:NodT family efflux transporter outer membrane factor (OMF) lipoprotein
MLGPRVNRWDEVPKRRMRLWLTFSLVLSGCELIGPDFQKPDSAAENGWQDRKDGRVSQCSSDYRAWWKSFSDPVLDELIQTAYRENLSLREAGLRILEARAQLGIAVGDFYPQKQHLTGFTDYIKLPSGAPSERLPDQTGSLPPFWWSRMGIAASWELDIWGKFRRAIEAADAQMLATIAAYDASIVSLTADVATTYIRIRTLEKKLDIARNNVQAQLSNLRIAEAKFRGGSSSRRDVEQAKTVLGGTQASIPSLDSQVRQAKNALSVLLGQPPGNLEKPLGSSQHYAQIPAPPLQVAVGIPLDLLRRRPDIREAEYQAQMQSAQIGITKAQLYPAFSLSGSFSFVSSTANGMSLGDMFQWGNQFYRFGPAVQWNIFNYGQITNQVRANDAMFQAKLVNYQNTVLNAQREVEDGLISFLKAQDAAEYLAQSTAAAKRSLELATLQYKEGIADFTTVLTAEQSLLSQQDNFASALGDIATGLVSVYRGLGGGWQIREGQEFLPEPIKAAMANRTNWGDLLAPAPVPEGPAKGTVRMPDW